MILVRRRTQQFREDRFQRIRPHLIPFDIQVKSVPIDHAFEKFALFVGQPIVDIYVPNRSAIGEPCDVVVDPLDDGHHGHVVPRSDSHQNNRRVGCFALRLSVAGERSLSAGESSGNATTTLMRLPKDLKSLSLQRRAA